MYKESLYNVEIKKDNNRKTLVYNTNKGVLSWFTQEVYDCFHNKQNISYNDLPVQFAKQLIQYGFIVPQELDEFNSLESERKSYLFNNFPETLSLTIAPTLLCNMQCTYCFEKCAIKETMSQETVSLLIDYIKKEIDRNTNLKTLYILWFGGEPLLEIPIIKQISSSIIPYAKEKNITYNSTIITNGYFLTKEISSMLKKECRVRFAQITLDGFAESYAKIKNTTKESFDIVVQNIVNSEIPINIRLNVTKDNQDEIIELSKFLLKDKGLLHKVELYIAHVREYDFNNNKNVVFNDEEYQMYRQRYFLELQKENLLDGISSNIGYRSLVSCTSMQKCNVVIGPDGNLYRCENALGNASCKIGDLKEGLYYNQEDIGYIDYQPLEKCRQCSLYPICGMGCRYEMIKENKVPNCDIKKERLLFEIEQYMANPTQNHLFKKC